MNNRHLTRKLILTVAPLLFFYSLLTPPFTVAGDCPTRHGIQDKDGFCRLTSGYRESRTFSIVEKR